MKKNKKKNIIIILTLCVLLLLLLVFSIVLNNIRYEDYYKYESRVDKLNSTFVEGTDTYGWLQVQGTNIDYPVFKLTNDGLDTLIDYIWRIDNFTDSYNREVILGHNLLNVSSEPIINGDGHSRFENLMNFVYYDFAKDNMYITYTYGGVDHIYKIYAVGLYYHKYNSNYPILKSDIESLDNYIKIAKENSLYDYDIDVNSSDTIMTLVTCTRYFGRDGKTDFRIDAREVRENEKLDKYSVETNDNYDIIK